MGMAAGQARLLSITSRMADNELRAQIINNNKMRLATQSSQVSENYVQALNEAQMMFTNYDKDNNASYQELTFNALTSYNPYNNQYALINSSGQILVSEKEATNFQNSIDSNGPNLEKFLACYGLEKTTTFFKNLKTDGNGENAKVLYSIGKTDSNGQLLIDQSTGFTADQLRQLYLGLDKAEDVEFLGGVKLYRDHDPKLESYDKTLSSQDYANYMIYLENYQEAHNNYLSLIVDAMDAEFESKLGKSLEDYKKEIEGWQTMGDAQTGFAKLRDLAGYTDATPAPALTGTLADPTYGSTASKFTNLGNALNSFKFTGAGGSCVSSRETYKKDNYTIVTDGAGYYFLASTKSDGTIDDILYCFKGNKIYEYNSSNKKFDKEVCPFGSTETYTDATKDAAGNIIPAQDMFLYTGTLFSNIASEYPNRDAGTDITLQTGDSRKFYKLEKTTGEAYSMPDIALKERYSLESLKNIAKNYLDNMATAIYTYWDVSASKWNNTALTKDKYKLFAEAAVQLGNAIYGDGKYTYNETSNTVDKADGNYPDIGILDNITELYNGIEEQTIKNEDGTTTTEPAKYLSFQTSFYNIFKNILLDNVMNTYGEPKIAWIDKNDENENGEAKYKWYSNLFEKMKSGYKPLLDGLASSTEWIKFAFESGIVTMQQVDSYNNWNNLNYTNCSDITEQTNSAAVAKAEAEYNAAMNKIENKDKRYDLELKNIDTEHNSLQTEYDSIKTAIDKNIERTFKLYS